MKIPESSQGEFLNSYEYRDYAKSPGLITPIITLHSFDGIHKTRIP